MQRVSAIWRENVRVDARLLIAFLALCLGLFIFGKLASEVMEGDSMALDHRIISALRVPGDPTTPIGPRWLLRMVRDVTALGGWTVLTLITVAVAGFLMVARRGATALFVIFAIAGGAILSTALKSLFNRPRPDIVAHLVDVHSTSFPSGHAMNSAIVYLTLGALLARTQQVRALRIYLLLVSIILALMIGASRVYLGVHWPSDVLAGWIVGATWATLCSLLARRLQKERKLEPGTTPKVA
ncbi:hypothetical protein C1T17_13910 [Sphingobium sp. SCG-1]|uniref:phosphatase PAP2 family protein n=1 Tax=Sphingobium sp. SCG-1 TaxID=2072936 RepID=UPI000CD68042|nr:phosphatase PAP2 family protein [Sphingobium sp. SCG-1]AUW59024.1 hypothetical protein C1T17_13910 [Sphingobium sp. SCG-1]